MEEYFKTICQEEEDTLKVALQISNEQTSGQGLDAHTQEQGPSLNFITQTWNVLHNPGPGAT